LGDQVLYTVGANLNWGLFDRYLTRTAVVRADVTARDAQIDYEDLKLQVEGEVKQAIGDYAAALQQLQSGRRGVKSAQESYDAVQERYKVGASSIVDLLTAQSALVQAQSSDAQARIGFVLEEKTMDNVLGRTEIPK
jgi:outer membrane protein